MTGAACGAGALDLTSTIVEDLRHSNLFVLLSGLLILPSYLIKFSILHIIEFYFRQRDTTYEIT